MDITAVGHFLSLFAQFECSRPQVSCLSNFLFACIMASSSSSAASSDASLKGINQRRNDYAMEFSDELKTGEVIVPWRGIGESGPEKPVIYPTKWPAHIETAMKRRGDKPLRLYADGIFDLCHYG